LNLPLRIDSSILCVLGLLLGIWATWLGELINSNHGRFCDWSLRGPRLLHAWTVGQHRAREAYYPPRGGAAEGRYCTAYASVKDRWRVIFLVRSDVMWQGRKCALRHAIAKSH
jgi:hypothetical protein